MNQEIAALVQLFQQGKFVELEAGARRFTERYPKHPLGWQALGLSLLQQNRFAEALPVQQQLLALQPQDPDALANTAIALRGLGHPAPARDASQRALAIQPRHVPAYLTLAAASLDLGDAPAALQACRQAITLEPQHPDAHNLLGSALLAAGQAAEAETALRRAVALNPNAVHAYNNLANALVTQGRLADAENALRRAVELAPGFAEAHNNLGNLFRELKRPEEAEQAFRKALEVQPDAALFHANLGQLLFEQGRLAEAEASCRQAIALDPAYAGAYNSLGNVLRDRGELTAAEGSFRQALVHNAQLADAHYNLGLLELAKGNFAAGWAGYEYRWHTAGRAHRRDYPQPQWNGTPLHGRTLLVWCEQGLGDSLQFVRYLPLLRRFEGRVVFECAPTLARLFAEVPGIDQLVPAGEPLPSFDCHCPLLSLPGLLGTRLDSIPADLPYLTAPADPAPAAKAGKPRIGIVWAGNADHANDRNRSISFDDIRNLLDRRDCTWVILQRDRRPEAFASLAARHGWEDPFATPDAWPDFAATAGLVAGLDLVIGVDTAAIHLAGALGRPAWTLLAAVSDWRWLHDRTDSPWYPAMRLFRQQHTGGWAPVLAEVNAALDELLAAPR